MKAYLITDDPGATTPLADELQRLGVASEVWSLSDRSLKLDETPPDGVFVNRAAPSGSLGRGERERLRDLTAWLEGYGRRLINGSGVVALESSRVLQHTALRAAGLPAPRTVAAAADVAAVRRAATEVNAGTGAFVVTSARPGTGAQRLESVRGLDVALVRGEVTLDGGAVLVREALGPADVVRVEFVGGTVRRAWRWRAEEGAGEVAAPVEVERVEAGDVVDDALLDRYVVFLYNHGFGIGAVELATAADGRRVTLNISGAAEPWRAWGGADPAVAAYVAFEARRAEYVVRRPAARPVRAAV